MQGRLEEQLPSLWMASVGGGGKTTSGLPPITVSLHDSRSLHGSIRCLLDGVSKHSRTLWGDRAYLLRCLLEAQLPAMWRFKTGGFNLIWLPQVTSAALLWATTVLCKVPTAVAISKGASGETNLTSSGLRILSYWDQYVNH